MHGMQRVLMGYKTAFSTLDALTFFIWLCLVVTIRTNDFREEELLMRAVVMWR
jgi:hypothetical protein